MSLKNRFATRYIIAWRNRQRGHDNHADRRSQEPARHTTD